MRERDNVLELMGCNGNHKAMVVHGIFKFEVKYFLYMCKYTRHELDKLGNGEETIRELNFGPYIYKNPLPSIK